MKRSADTRTLTRRDPGMSGSMGPAPSPTRAARAAGRAAWRDWLELTKPEITFLVVISGLAGFVLGSTSGIDGWTLVWALLGIGLTSAGGCVLNHVREVDLDARMKRTATRPLPSGRIDADHARAFGYGAIAAGLGILCPLTNPLTGVLAALTVALYLYVYTPLKQKSVWNTLVGTIPGALPILGGWTAATGSLGPGGWALFGVLVCWQMPHFLSLAWMYRKDYERAGFAMLPVLQPSGQSTAIQSVVFSIGMVGFSLLPSFQGLVGPFYLSGASALGVLFLIPVIRFARSRSVPDARALLKATVRYIPLLLGCIVLDRLFF